MDTLAAVPFAGRTFTLKAADPFTLELSLERLFCALAKQRYVVTKTTRSADWREVHVEYRVP